MECRRVSTCAVSFGYAAEDKLKRNQYLSIIKCRLDGKEEGLGDVQRYFAEGHAYYCVLDDLGRVSWFAVSGTSSFLAQYKVSVSEEETNIFEFLRAQKHPPRDAECSNVSSRTKLCFVSKGVYIEAAGEIRLYTPEGKCVSRLPTGLDKVAHISTSVCETYLVVQYESGSVCVHTAEDSALLYQKTLLKGTLSLCGDVFEYAIFLCCSGKSVQLVRACTGQVLLEVSFPEELLSASLDTLQRRLIVGSASGTVYHTRLDGEPPEFMHSKVSSSPITMVYFSLCGSMFYVQTGGFLLAISVRDGKVIRSTASEGKHFFTRTTNSNLHLQ
ncbi:hypothetical protein NECID01_0486 [Nematocida sp. AWRm77]|nr:hypothetical protein NECID01_0486 [Nematocida sp. AWRm77]